MPGPGTNPTTSGEFADTFKQMNEAETVVAKLEKLLDNLDNKIDSILNEVNLLDSNYLNNLDQKVDQQINLNYSSSLQQQILNPNQNISSNNNMNSNNVSNNLNKSDINNTTIHNNSTNGSNANNSQSLNNILDGNSK
ncbi:uncharacterized protein ASCRUDRAFT_9920 [Ascoidea rubescens DSM 1968]|uniref:Uncharacterized protein n=1 Tax=Ascoidea rubescens DSM 1968 TaxID=1344418 RepID=A0A1D2VBL4_9ASCO|nr:hypothetical protein ASCRUDRAFT_9920 [Ascoidea rubescens DSM 1968]ODV58847.1 hypothetical protein ASCRUDRAFT_9920 [Ascoidea rubescens DSM 1968]